MANRFSETRTVSSFIAAFIALFVGLLALVFLLSYANRLAWMSALVAVGVFVFAYFITKYTIEKFIYEKIKLIYKTIHGFRAGKSQEADAKENSGTLEQVNEAVMEWGAKQRTEIEELKKMAAYRREFLGNISHELKTPIFNIQGYLLTLLDGGLEDETINKNYLLRSEKSVNRLIAIVEDLEEISKLESGELKLNLQWFDLLELTGEVVEFLEMKARKAQTKVHIDHPRDQQLMVKADKKRLRQVLINLVENAIKYGDKPETVVRIRFFDMDENYLVEVKDNGPGISAENLPRVFERFYRTDRGRARSTGGTGLGLAIVKHIINAHGQTITAQSSPGEGTTFAFTMEKG